MFSRKRPQRRRVEEAPQYPHVPKDAINDGLYDPDYTYKSVRRTVSPAWGSKQIAEARSLVETAHDGNLDLLRTYHPGLATSEVVYLTARKDGVRFWQLIIYDSPAAYTHAGGLEIHLQPKDYIQPRLGISIGQRSLTQSLLNPRRLLSQDDVDGIRSHFPHSTGAELLMVGHLVILLASASGLRKDGFAMAGEIAVVSNLFIYLRILKNTPSTSSSSAVITDSKNGDCALGLRIKLTSGESAITTVTHAFAHSGGFGRNTIYAATVCNWAHKACHKLFYGGDLRRLPLVLSQMGCWSPFSLSLGKTVHLCEDGSAVGTGTITQTYDTPSRVLPYPAGYAHDVSLVAGHDLPKCDASWCQSRIKGWASIREVLDGAPIFTCGKSGQIDPAVLQGMQYLWGDESAGGAPSIAFVWRSVKGHSRHSGGHSGSGMVLCVGDPAASETRAVAFHNFNLPSTSAGTRDEMLYGIHGGFILPEAIYRSQIEG